MLLIVLFTPKPPSTKGGDCPFGLCPKGIKVKGQSIQITLKSYYSAKIRSVMDVLCRRS